MTPKSLEKAKEIIESYCPPEAKHGAYINSKMLTEDIAQAIDSIREETLEEAAKVADEDKGTLATRVAQRIRKLKRQDEKV